MALGYRLVVGHAQDVNRLEYTDDSNVVNTIECELQSEAKRVSYLSATIADPGLKSFGKLQDPAFANIPVNLWMSPPGTSQRPTVLVFTGKVTGLQVSYPGPETLHIAAHDLSIDARRTSRLRVFAKKTSKQIVEAVIKDYGLTIDEAMLGDVSLVQRAIEIGITPSEGSALSDWDLMRRCLAADGLNMYVKGKKVVIHQFQKDTYSKTFTRGESPVVGMQASINHIGRPGQGGDKVSTAFGTKNDRKTLPASLSQEAKKIGATERGARAPLAGPGIKTLGAHTEDPGGAGWKNQVTALRQRKDTMQLICFPLPDFEIKHMAKLDGWGSKLDGYWFTKSIKHTLVPGGNGSMTALSLIRGPSSGAAKAAKIGFLQTKGDGKKL